MPAAPPNQATVLGGLGNPERGAQDRGSDLFLQIGGPWMLGAQNLPVTAQTFSGGTCDRCSCPPPALWENNTCLLGDSDWSLT